MSSGRLFQSFGPTEANERSPTVTRRDGRTSSWLEVADRRRRRDGKLHVDRFNAIVYKIDRSRSVRVRSTGYADSFQIFALAAGSVS